MAWETAGGYKGLMTVPQCLIVLPQHRRILGGKGGGASACCNGAYYAWGRGIEEARHAEQLRVKVRCLRAQSYRYAHVRLGHCLAAQLQPQAQPRRIR